MSMLKVDLELVKKYNVPGPRYTSYPPATHFTNEITPDAFIGHIRANNQTDRDLSLYFHLPFCYSLCWFCGCTTVITADQKKSGEYLNYLEREMDLMKPLLNPKRKVLQLHFGGGTPTFLLPDEIRRLGEMIRSRFTFAPDIEAGVEVDPRRLTRDHLVALREVGFNRGSMGVQDDDPVVQKAVHRIQPLEMTRQVVEWMREVGFHSVNIDLIYGLPYQTPASFAKTLDEMLSPEAGPVRGIQLRPRALDEAGAEDSEARDAAVAGNQAGVAQADHRAAYFRGLRLYRHGPLRARMR
jgi:oxygen-independent coproporphyrinogen-3 oxidase